MSRSVHQRLGTGYDQLRVLASSTIRLVGSNSTSDE